MLAAPPGTVLYFRWANIGPDVACAWVDADYKPFGFVDDGSPHEGRPIHSPRVPIPKDAPALYFDEIKVLHYQYADWNRMRSKQRWYQVWERLNDPKKRPVTIFRQYHHMERPFDGRDRYVPNGWPATKRLASTCARSRRLPITTGTKRC
ncbi:hypothetical protein [Rhodothermus marinus]|uniref:hypothetical protein n=1 Tax=Rhodothermus marinus TaxID=29549 RepID=UPI001FB2B55D|nr:hypothetical protein [Rhodothermus marinus]